MKTNLDSWCLIEEKKIEMKDRKENLEDEVNQNLFDPEKDTRRVLKNNSPIMCMEFLLSNNQNSGNKENESTKE